MKKILASLFFLVLCSASFAGPKEDLIGYYKVDVKTIKKFDPNKEDVASLSEERQAIVKEQFEIMEKAMSGVVLHFTEKEITTWIMDKPKRVIVYTIEKEDGNTLTIKREKSKKNGVLVVAKDSFVLISEGDTRYLKITEKEAKEMIAKVEAEVERKEAPPINEEFPAEGGMK